MTKEFLINHQAGLKYAGGLIGSAMAGFAIGCAAGKLDEFQRKSLTPFISKLITQVLRTGGMLEDDIQASKF